MKSLTQEQIVCIGATTEAEAIQASEGTIECCPSYQGGKRDLFLELQGGRISASTITVNGVRSYIIFWRVEMGGCLHVLGAYGLPGGQQSFASIIEGCEEIGAANGCTFATVASARKGYERVARAHGGRPVSVWYAFPNRKLQPAPCGACSQGRHD